MTYPSWNEAKQIWIDPTKNVNFFALDWRGQGDPDTVYESPAKVFCVGEVITRIEFADVPLPVRIPNTLDESDKHHRASGALAEQSRIIQLLGRFWCGDPACNEHPIRMDRIIEAIKGETA